ncbi:unnamed protein product [Periconia digitata]|uniref:F-box domain-containing protein n=1 Tax=Periconia digitata TaxID=1303443 RepID=A0A9W4XGL1_9PLEO|nr:unnamed protein product [Periconia digitata]
MLQTMSPALDTLPPEILFHILSFTDPFLTSSLPNHPLYSVAATSNHLSDIVEEYSRGLLKRHANIAPSKTPKAATLPCRRRWVRWIKETCQICRRASKRKAILEAGQTCCAKCDREKYPKMTQTDAINTHGLSKLDIFTPNALHPNLPPLSLGTYMCMGGSTLMLATNSVLSRKAHIHGLLGVEKASDTQFLRRRVAAHDRLIKHMGIVFQVRAGTGIWVKRRQPGRDDRRHGGSEVKAKTPLSMASAQTRDTYVNINLEKEWAAMGMSVREADPSYSCQPSAPLRT